jgi:3-methyladenine DNA glycosylase AlkD
VRALARALSSAHRGTWTFEDALSIADALLGDPCFEMKALGVELLARYRRHTGPRHLHVWKRWLATNRAANWATTDSLCGALIGPLLLREPSLVPEVASWAVHRNLWVRRASAVTLVKLAARGLALDTAYGVASALQGDSHDLIHKAAGWLLREAGRTDARRLERYLLAQGPRLPRTTLRYAVEHMPAADRKRMLVLTRHPAAAPGRSASASTAGRGGAQAPRPRPR